MPIDRKTFLTITGAASGIVSLTGGANASERASLLDARTVRATHREEPRLAHAAAFIGVAGRCASSRGARSWHGGFTLADFAP